jgi:hypothetical protein
MTMEPVYTRLRAAMEEEEALNAYCDDAYLIAKPEKLSTVLTQAPETYGKVGPRLGYGPKKTEPIIIQGFDRAVFPYALDDPTVMAPQVVDGFKACMGVPRHHANDQTFIIKCPSRLGI